MNNYVPRRRQYDSLEEFMEEGYRLRRRERTSSHLSRSLPCSGVTATTTAATVGSPRTQYVTVSYINPDGRVKKKRLERRYINA